jgi:hypothetical protein
MTPAGFRLSAQQWEMFDLLASRARVSEFALKLALYGDRLDCDLPRWWQSGLRVQIARLRRRLAPLGMQVACLRAGPHEPGLYYFPPDSRRRARALIRARADDAPSMASSMARAA